MRTIDNFNKALEKYNQLEDYTYDFEDVRSNIRVTMEHLKVEMREHAERERQTPWIITLVGFLTVYVPKLIQFSFSCYSSKVDITVMVLYAVFLSATIFCLVKFMLPRQRIQLDEPKVFYSDLMDRYKADETIDKSLVNMYVQHSYLNHLSECVDGFRECNIAKSVWRFRTLIAILASSIVYVVCIAIQLIKTPI